MNSRALILVVDDVPTNIHVLLAGLQNDYDVKIATNGAKALELASMPDRPDLVLLDIMMPDMDGYEVCRRLKGNVATAGIPVIFITALSDAGQEKLGFDLGAADYITKPFDMIVVRARIRTQLELKFRQDELKRKNEELAEALRQVKTLKGMLPICSSCKKIRDDEGYWNQIEVYISNHSDAEFTHGICPECARRLYGVFMRDIPDT